jgi:threonine/homoserine efflux transporter RhtA
MSLGPAIAAIAGYLILNQALTLTEALAAYWVPADSLSCKAGCP